MKRQPQSYRRTEFSFPGGRGAPPPGPRTVGRGRSAPLIAACARVLANATGRHLAEARAGSAGSDSASAPAAGEARKRSYATWLPAIALASGPHSVPVCPTTTHSPRSSGIVKPALALEKIPVTVKILLENVVRNAGSSIVRDEEVAALASWEPGVADRTPQTAEAPDLDAASAAESPASDPVARESVGAASDSVEIPFLPARVILQDFTGVPAVVDLAAMRDAMAELGGDPSRVNPLVPADLVIDHSVQVDRYGTPGAFAFNVGREYERNGERYQLLRWAQTAFRDLRVVPPGTGIVHQVNLEYLADVVSRRRAVDGAEIAIPDTLVGTDSHTTMINGLGVLGYGVGGIEAEAVLLGQPLYQPLPRVIGVRLSGELPEGVHGHGPGPGGHPDAPLLWSRGLVRRVQRRWARGPGHRGPRHDLEHVSRVRRDVDALPDRRRDAGVHAPHRPRTASTWLSWRDMPRSRACGAIPGVAPDFDALLTLDLGSVEPSLAGPRRPQDRVALRDLARSFRSVYPAPATAPR